MGFFKKIGQGVKKFAKKNIRFKNVVSLVGKLDKSGLVSGMQDAHYMKKEAKAQADAEKAYQAQLLAQEQGAKLGQAVGTLGGEFVRSTGKVAMDEINKGAGDVIAYGTTNLMDSTINEWFKRHWIKLVGGLIGLLVLIFAVRKMSK